MLQRNRAGLAIITLTSMAAFGCGGDAPETGEATEPAATESAAPAAAVADAATVNGSVSFGGTVPAAKVIDMSEEKVCADKHPNGASEEAVVVNNGKLQNVFVYVKDGLTGAHTGPGQKVVIDQDGCVYKPHVAGVMVGQDLAFKNSDGVLHNIKAVPTAQRGFNISQPTTMETAKQFTAKEVMVPVQCDVHGWMQAYVGVLDHPYFAVSGTDGNFSIGNLPPGTYTIEAWHEKYGTQSQSVTVGPNETKDITFSFSAATATRVPLADPIIIPHGGAHAAHSAGAR